MLKKEMKQNWKCWITKSTLSIKHLSKTFPIKILMIFAYVVFSWFTQWNIVSRSDWECGWLQWKSIFHNCQYREKQKRQTFICYLIDLNEPMLLMVMLEVETVNLMILLHLKWLDDIVSPHEKQFHSTYNKIKQQNSEIPWHNTNNNHFDIK